MKEKPAPKHKFSDMLLETQQLLDDARKLFEEPTKVSEPDKKAKQAESLPS